MPPPRPPARRRKWPRRLLGAFFVLALLLGGGAFYSFWSASLEMSSVLAQIDRLDPGWRLEDLEARRRSIPDAQNSALKIVAISRLQAGQTVWTPAMDKLFGENGISEAELPPQVQLNDQQTAYLMQRLELLRKPILEARQLANFPDGRFPLTYTADFYSTRLLCQDARGVAELLRWDAVRRVHDGDADGAIESCLAIMHAARSLGDEPFLISQLVRYACVNMAVDSSERTLAQGHFAEASLPSLQRLQSAQAKEAAEPTLLRGLRGERAGANRFLEALAEGKISTKAPGTVLGSTVLGGEVAYLAALEHVPGYLTRERAALLGYLNTLVETAKLPAAEGEERFNALEKETRGKWGLVRLLAPATSKIRAVECRIRANLLCASAGLAAERYRIRHNQWPDSLEALVKAELLPAVPLDPFDEKPLRLERTAAGLIIYSVGQDKVDNGGLIDRRGPTAPGTDLGFRLWDISQRRQLPHPLPAD